MVDREPLVSIILPTYNGARYIRESIESCLGQTHSNLELIIVDDYSTDATPQIVREYSDPRIILVQHDYNKKLPSALNTGFAHSRGEYLTWTSDDNRYAPTAIEEMVHFLEDNPQVSFVYTDYWIIDQDGQIIAQEHVKEPECLVEYDCVGACFLYRREVYETIGKYNPRAWLAEDYEYWLRVSQKFVMAPLHQSLYYYRLHRSSLTGQFGGGTHPAQRVAHRVRRDLGIITNTEYRRALAQVDIDEAFLHYQNGNLATARSLLIRGLCQDPRWCKNRGVISILLQSLGIWHKRTRPKNYA